MRTVFIFVLAFMCFGNQLHAKMDVDSLKQLLQKPSISNEYKLEILQQLASENIENGQLDLAKGFIMDGLDLARDIEYISTKAKFFLTASKVLKTNEEQTRASHLIRNAIKIYTSLNDKEGMGEAYTALGVWQQNNYALDSAIGSYKLSLKNKGNNTNQKSLGATIMNLGRCFLQMSMADSSIIYFEKGKDIWAILNDKASLGSAFCGLGAAHLQNGNNESFSVCYKKGLELLADAKEITKYRTAYSIFNFYLVKWNRSEETVKYEDIFLRLAMTLKDSNQIATAYIYKAENEFRKNKLHNSVLYYDSALSAVPLIDKQDITYNILFSKSKSFSAIDINRNALKTYFQAIELAKDEENYSILAQVYWQLSDMYRDANDLDSVIIYLRLSLKANTKTDDAVGISVSYRMLASAYMEVDSFVKAEDALNKSLEYFKKTDQSTFVFNPTKTAFAELYYRKGEFDKAAEIWDSVLAASNKKGMERVYRQHKVNAAKTYFQLKNYNKVVRLLMHDDMFKYISDFAEYDKTGQTLNNFNLLYKSYKRLNRVDSALAVHEIYKRVSDSISKIINNAEDIMKLAKLEYRQDLYRHKKEQEAQAVVTKLKLDRRNNFQYALILFGLFFLFSVMLLAGKFTFPKWLVQLSVFVPFLILFEFILVLLDPQIEQFSGGAPGYKLLINAAIAALIFPAHSFFESYVKGKLLSKKDRGEG